MKKLKNALKIMAILLALFPLVSCNPIEKDSTSSSMLIVVNITGKDSSGNEANFLQSDVARVDTTTGVSYVTADTATATLKASMLDPKPALGASQYSDIIVTRYCVSYSRSDGKSVEGKDVPFSFEGSLSTLIKVNSTADISFVVVREVAKLEPPLVNLANSRDEGVIQCTAKIDFYGHDVVNNTVKATGYLAIYFGNYIDK
jgi:hypothetical protein